jgi:ankyrin repeat protein
MRTRILLVFAALVSTTAHADNYYPNYSNSNYTNYTNYSGSGNYQNYYSGSSYNSYRGSNSAGPIFSLELDPQKSLNESMRVAAREERIQDVTDFITRGADVNSTSETGETALMYASRSCNAEVVHTLLRHRARINQRDANGRTALMYAVSETCLPVVRLLLEIHGTDVRAHDEQKMTALDYAQAEAVTDVDGPAVAIVKLLEEYRVAKTR